MDKAQRAKEGVGVIVTRQLNNKVTYWEPVNSRIIRIDLELEEKITCLQIYAPTDDKNIIEKETFYTELQRTINKIRTADRHLIIMGDWNSRVGNNKQLGNGVLGNFGGEGTINNNGERMLEFCIENQLIIGNSFFKHKNIHQITFEGIGRGVKSIIDYFTYNKNMRYAVLDVRVYRTAELSTEHKLLIMKTRYQKMKQNMQIKYTKVKTEELRKPEVRSNYEKNIEEVLGKIKDEQLQLEERWKILKETMVTAVEKVCGLITVNNRVKHTKWWNDDIKQIVKKKKEIYKLYLRTKSQEDREKYVEARNEVKQAVRSAKQKSWEEFGQEIEDQHKNNNKKFWTTVKNIRKGYKKPVRNIENKQKQIVTETSEVLEVWRTYYEETFKDTNETNIEINSQNKETESIEEITMTELESAIKRVKLGKAAGWDNITPEMVKFTGEKAKKWMLKLINQIWEGEHIPKDWENNIIIPIYKKGSTTQCQNYRAICLSSVMFKLYTRIIETRLRQQVESKLEEEQGAYRPGRQTHDHIFTVRNIMEKATGYNKNTYLAFIDLQAAFDSVPKNEIWKAMEKIGATTKIISAIKNLYRNVNGVVRLNGQTSQQFKMEKGMKQGDCLSPLLFIIFMDQIIKENKGRTRSYKVGNWKMNEISIHSQVYADDILLIAGRKEDLQKAVKEWATTLENMSMKVNINKSKVMKVGKEPEEVTISWRGETLEQVSTYEYLGVTISDDGKYECEINNRITKANNVYYSINNTIIGKKEISTKTKMSIFQSIYIPTLTYGMESIPLTKAAESRITAMEMKYLRKTVNVTKRDRIRNIVIREELKQKPLIGKIEEKKLKWFGHLVRMKEDRIVKKVFEAKTDGKRSRGRPRIDWEADVESICRKKGISTQELRRMAKDRKKFRKWLTDPTH